MNYFDALTEGISVPLTKLASGYKPTGLVADQVFPTVGAVASSGTIPVFSSKDAFKIYETLRAKGAYSKRATISPDSWTSYACHEHDLAIPLDQRELDELKALPSDSVLKALFSLEDRQRRRVQYNMALEVEQLIANYIQTGSNYPIAHVETLVNGDCWSEAGSDPVTMIEAAREQIRDAIGLYPNTMIMGHATEALFKFHPAYTDLLNANKDKIVTLETVAAVHDIQKIIVGGAKALDAQGNLVDLWGDFFQLCYIPPSTTPDIDEPAFGYLIRPTFSPKPYPYVDVFTEEGGKLVNIRCTDFYGVVMVMSACGYLILNTKK
jgi:hypothetical protein